jgi:tRNA pseudouridine55 synthase
MVRVTDGVLVVDKPRGPTSHDVVARLRRVLRTRAVGHAGTLDPMATGVLVVAIGEGTKLVPWLTAHDKAYEATIALGVETDTLDALGREVRRADPGDALRAALAGSAPLHEVPMVRAALEQERARAEQVPPAYSAIRTGGERAFARARRGEAPEMAPRPVAVRRLEVLEWAVEPPSVRIEVEVAKGYYVRALARDFADALGTAGHLTMLRRLRSGCFGIAEATALDAPPDAVAAAIEPVARAAARALPAVRLSLSGARDARHGRAVQVSDMEAGEWSGWTTRTPLAWFDQADQLVAVGQIEDDGCGHVLRGFAGDAAGG